MSSRPEPEEFAALRQAFDLFRRSSGDLAASYDALQDEVRRLNRALAEAYQRLAAELKQREQLLNLLPGAVLVLNTDGCVEGANDRAGALFGAIAYGEPWGTALTMRPTAAEEQDEFLLETPAGIRRLALTRSERPVPGGEILLFTDITAARERELKRRRRERLAEMGRMAANLAHQLRTPLATALLYLSQLDAEDLAPEQRIRYQARALERLQRLEQLVRDTLRHVRDGDDRGRSVCAGDLVIALQRAQLPLFRQKNVTLEVVAPPVLRLPGTLEGWEAVLGNLLANALYFTPGGRKVILQVANIPEGVEMTVEDEGTGLKAEAESRLFEPFFTTRTDGTGLGLSIVRDYVESLGGRISAANSPQGGCRIHIGFDLIGTKLA